MVKKISFMTAALILGAFFLTSADGAEPNRLRINCTLHSPYEIFFFRLVEEVCSRNHITVERHTPPVGRSLIRVDQCIDDGDGPRILGLETTYPNLVRVPEPFGDFVFGAFAKSGDIAVEGWSSLESLNVAYIHGWKIFDAQVTAAKSITKVRNKDLLFGLLEAGRTDVALITRLAGYAEIQRLGLTGIRFIEPPLAVEPNFLYLCKKHRELAPRLARTLRDLKRDGTYRRIYGEIISPYLSD